MNQIRPRLLDPRIFMYRAFNQRAHNNVSGVRIKRLVEQTIVPQYNMTWFELDK